METVVEKEPVQLDSEDKSTESGASSFHLLSQFPDSLRKPSQLDSGSDSGFESVDSPPVEVNFALSGIDLPSFPVPGPALSRVSSNKKPLAKPVNQVLLLKTIFEGRSSTVLFDYPSQCLLPSRASGQLIEDSSVKLTFRISSSVHTYNCVVNAFTNAGFAQTNSKKANVLIKSIPKVTGLKKLKSYQFVNHFPGILQLGRKDLMWRNINSKKRSFGADYEICPQTFVLPDDYDRIQQERDANPQALWILKPSGASCGKGIRVLSADCPLSKKQFHIISRYISNPHTINGLKYDLRVYVCVTSFDPLKVYLYEDGLVRFATETYSSDKKSLKKRFIHLTNFSVNKKSSRFVRNQNAGTDNEGSKWSLRALRKLFNEKGIDTEEVFARIEDVIIKALISVEPKVVTALNQVGKSGPTCFEVYGFDILLDSHLKPWLLEVNIAPSFSSSSPIDKRIKTALMCDLFNLIGITPINKKKAANISEGKKSSRLFGYEKPFKTGSLNALLNSSLENYQLSDTDLNVIASFEEEIYRAGEFKMIFPTAQNCNNYAQYFEMTRYNNLLIWKYLKEGSRTLGKYLVRL